VRLNPSKSGSAAFFGLSKERGKGQNPRGSLFLSQWWLDFKFEGTRRGKKGGWRGKRKFGSSFAGRSTPEKFVRDRQGILISKRADHFLRTPKGIFGTERMRFAGERVVEI